jgi:hypothetical protein
MESNLQVPQKCEHKITYNQAISLLSSKELSAGINISIPLFIAAFCKTAKGGNNPIIHQ